MHPPPPTKYDAWRVQEIIKEQTLLSQSLIRLNVFIVNDNYMLKNVNIYCQKYIVNSFLDKIWIQCSIQLKLSSKQVNKCVPMRWFVLFSVFKNKKWRTCILFFFRFVVGNARLPLSAWVKQEGPQCVCALVVSVRELGWWGGGVNGISLPSNLIRTRFLLAKASYVTRMLWSATLVTFINDSCAVEFLQKNKE